MYALPAHPHALRELDRLPPRIAAGLRAVLQELAAKPRHRKFDLRRLKAVPGHPPAQRLRVGEYRVILRIDHAAKEVLIARVVHRSAVYDGVEHLDD